MQSEPDPKQLSRFVTVFAVMAVLFVAASGIVMLIPWLFNTIILGKD